MRIDKCNKRREGERQRDGGKERDDIIGVKNCGAPLYHSFFVMKN